MGLTTDIGSVDFQLAVSTALPNTVLYSGTGKGTLKSLSYTIQYDTGFSFRITVDGRQVFDLSSIGHLAGLGTPLMSGGGTSGGVFLNIPFTSSLKIEISAVANSSHRQVKMKMVVIKEAQ